MDALDALDPTTTALLSIDFQRDIIAESKLAPEDAAARARFEAAIEAARGALRQARRHGVLVVHVRVAYSAGYPEASPHGGLAAYMKQEGVLLDGSPGAAIDARVAPEGDEPILTKHGISAFSDTGLLRMLRMGGISNVALAGLVTHYAVEGSAREAADLGFRTLVLTDACASGSPARHDMALTNLAPLCTLTDVAGFGAALAAAPAPRPRFHMAFAVRDLEATRAFYCELLGAKPGRSAERWIDFDFWGHQISAHLVAEDALAQAPTNPVDGDQVPARHFGVILPRAQWQELTERLREAGVSFLIEPHVRFAGKPGEQATAFVLDPSGNAIELKSFAHDGAVFEVHGSDHK
ncbi:MAG: isochorismatase family protein [Myxococcales bacterium]|nr:isochorismatase family protein [Myxococcales bacterium]